MPTKNRNGRLYFYQNRRDGDRVISHYQGSGTVAQISAFYAERDRRNRQQEKLKLKAQKLDMAEIDSLLDEFDELAQIVTTGALMVAGFHRHNGQWRKNKMSAVYKFKESPRKTEGQYASELSRLIREASADSSKLEALMRYFDDNPDLFAQVSQLPIVVKLGLIDKITASAAESLCILEECKTKKRLLLADGKSMAEEFLAQNVVLCWLRLQLAELDRTQVIGSDYSIKYIECIDKALTRAQNRFLKALDSLARYKALLAR